MNCGSDRLNLLRCAWLGVLLAMVVQVSPPGVRAHGPDMAVIGILTGDADTPGLVRLTRGLAAVNGESLQFICPERWGGPEAPGVAAQGNDVVVAGLRGPVLVAADGRVTPLSTEPELQAGRVRAVASDGARVLGLTTAGAVWQLAPGTPRVLLQLEDQPDALVALGAGRWVLASESDGELQLMELQKVGELAEVSAPFVRAPFRANPTLVDTQSEAGEPVLWVVGTANDGRRLWRVDGSALTLLTLTAEPIFGPVAVGGETFVVLGGQVHRVRGNAVEPMAATPRVFCLQVTSEGAMTACVGVDLHRFATDTGVGEAVLRLAALREPALDGLGPAASFGCRAEWQDAAIDAGLPSERVNPAAWQVVEPGPEVVESQGAASGDGCAGGRAVWALVPLGWVCGVGRRWGHRRR